MRKITPLLLSGLLLTTCCDDPVSQGGQGQSCYPNDTCNVGFLCSEGRCEAVGDDCGDGVCSADESVTSCPEDCDVELVCGNDIVDSTEACDGSDLSGRTCTTLGQGYMGGDLGCLADCSGFDESGCHSCGDAIIQIPEVCDGFNLGGLSCLDVGFLSGELACSADCLAHVTTDCKNSCEEPSCPACIASSCAQAACESEHTTCDANPDCLSLSQCFTGCADISCQDACYQQYPAGLESFMALRNCLMCDPNVCLDECAGVTACP